MAGKFKRAAKSCLLIVYRAESGSLKGKKVVYCLLSDRAGKVKRPKVVNCLFIGQGSLKERLKVVYCLLTGRVRKFKRKAESC